MHNKKTIVFLGDSIIRAFDVHHYFKNYHVYNEGINGNTTFDVLKRLDSSVYSKNPDIVVLLVGTNDLNRPPANVEEEIIERLKLIIKKIKTFNPNIKIILQAIYPVNYDKVPSKVGIRTNELIIGFNEKLSKIQDVIFLNVYNELLFKEELKIEYTDDGLHINEQAYNVVARHLNKILEGGSFN